MLKQDEVLTEAAGARQAPPIPPALSQVAYGEAVIDSREATPGSLFVALSGEKVDGHDFLADAVARAPVGRWCAASRSRGRRSTGPPRWSDATGAGLAGRRPRPCC